MAGVDDEDTARLLEQAAAGDPQAVERLMARHRQRLRRMVAVRIDRRLAARLDPSDVVQEALAEAARRLGEYLAQPRIAFFAWLRRLTWERLLQARERHFAQKRNVQREIAIDWDLPDESVYQLAEEALASHTSPSQRLRKEELRERVRAAFDQLPAREREVMILRYLEQLGNREIAEVLGTTEGSVKSAHFRAVEKLQQLLGEDRSSA
jgi:RNA polymerase sigma-70 factor (ECF subfamily)